jgi:hypothetical protein
VDGPTSISESLERCRKRLARLQSLGAELGGVLRATAGELLESGRLPSGELIEQLQEFRSEFQQLDADIPRSTTEASEGDRESGEVRSLLDIQEDLEVQSLIHASLTRLECVSMIRHVEQEEFKPWQRCLEDGTRLRSELLSVPATQARVAAEQFLSPQAPLNAVVTLVADGRRLTDERWTALLDSVSVAYGREVTTAIARGKLVLVTGSRP